MSRPSWQLYKPKNHKQIKINVNEKGLKCTSIIHNSVQNLHKVHEILLLRTYRIFQNEEKKQ